MASTSTTQNAPIYTKFSDLTEKFDTFIFDCDGVLWTNFQPIGESPKVLNHLLDLGKQVIFITNLSKLTRAELAENLNKIGVNIDYETQMFNSSSISASYIRMNHPDLHKVYVMGGDGLSRELNSVGIQAFGSYDDDDKSYDPTKDSVDSLDLPDDADGVILAKDPKINSYKLARMMALHRRGAPIFLSGPQPLKDIQKFCPDDPNGKEIVAMNLTAIAKPNPFGFDLMRIKNTIDPTTSVMVGDMNSDIIFGAKCGMSTYQVLTGDTNKEEFDKEVADPNIVSPTYWSESMST
eukprot:CAMPEP_0115014928 /NCGR_PEP_ID=MMETSP0216-20121206/26411_1 /TAXON_ID=223996 /ORGANISM="Protocruzia adherens, Strain Boccale" /LENGTH=293 /DNA_ID=CAMNT_0002384843 /DNA_START=109 /DNA_END=990 /DNA_ORIENTATION=+